MNVSWRHRLFLSFLTGIVVVILSPQVLGQQAAGTTGDIRIIQDEKVDLLVSKHIQVNQNRRWIDGYRIQIFFDSGTNSKTKAQSIYDSFKGRYPETGTYLTFKAPNYKVRVGDFRTRLDAQRFLNSIIGEYPNAWIIEDMINLPKVE
jgi:hypothetical protein